MRAFLMLLFFFSMQAHAIPTKCVAALLHNFQSPDSSHHQLKLDNLRRKGLERIVYRLDKKDLLPLRNFLFKQIGCLPEDNYVPLILKSCRLLKKIRPLKTTVCYAEDFYGSYFFSQDNIGHINIIFNRWD